MRKLILSFSAILILYFLTISGCRNDNNQNDVTEQVTDTCGPFGTLPMRTIYPVTIPLECEDGQQLTWQQNSVIRYACVNFPDQASKENHKWPLIVHLHGSIVTPMSIYTFGRDLFDQRDTFQLSDNESVIGFILLSPEGRLAKPFTGPDPESGEGLHWDTWYRNPDENLDAQAIDHFIDEVIATGKVDTTRIYVFGWSNGAVMTVLYSSWRSSRIAAMGQYAGANPWSRPPCPVPMKYTRQVPLYFMRNLCDFFIPCDLSAQWLRNLDSTNWPYVYHNLNYLGDSVSHSTPCYPDSDCSKVIGIANHGRWPRLGVLIGMLQFFKEHPL